MDLSSKSPAEIDAAALAASNAYAQAISNRDRAYKVVERIEGSQSGYEGSRAWNSLAALKAAQDEINVANATIIRANAKMAQYLTEFDSRGGWTRYYLVTNTNGHVHSSTHCSTCFPTTSYAWLTEQSGMTAEALVELAGESACTECFPWAPVSTLRRHSVLEAPERKAARLEREAAKAARDAKKIAKALTADGSEFVVRYGEGRFDREFFKTEQAASQWVVSHLADAKTYPQHYTLSSGQQEAVNQIVRAMSVKHNITTDAVVADLDRKVSAKIKRDQR